MNPSIPTAQSVETSVTFPMAFAPAFALPARKGPEVAGMKKIIAVVLLASAAGTAWAGPVQLNGRPFLEVAELLKPGQYVWAPELAPSGPTLVVINLATQRLAMFRGGVAVAASTISSGKPGHETPTGVFTILQKREKHFSKTYNNAPMPNMQRLTWKGIALHAGNLPGYPASHGCVRLPLDFSRLLFGETSLGMTVVITSLSAVPEESAPPAIAAAVEPSSASMANASYEWHPERGSDLDGDAIVSVVVSIADQRAIVMKGGVQIGSAPVTIGSGSRGAEAYVLESWDNRGPHWVNLRFSKAGEDTDAAASAKKDFDVPTGFREAVLKAMRPGSVVVVTPGTLREGAPGRSQTVIEAEPG
jgi:hypothetical protein